MTTKTENIVCTAQLLCLYAERQCWLTNGMSTIKDHIPANAQRLYNWLCSVTGLYEAD